MATDYKALPVNTGFEVVVCENELHAMTAANGFVFSDEASDALRQMFWEVRFRANYLDVNH